MTDMLGKTESPIEADLLNALLAVSDRCVLVPDMDWPAIRALAQTVPRNIYIRPQMKIGRYRIDLFLISGRNMLCVECDGDAYHQATSEQRIRDEDRDAWLAEQRLRTRRIRGRHIWRDCYRCAYETIQDLTGEDIRATQDISAGRAIVGVLNAAIRNIDHDLSKRITGDREDAA